MASSPSRTSDDDFPIEEVVFSCTICQATISEVYATTESNKGFHSGSGDEDGIVTKLWIAECSHITCAKHLENGAPPFHPKDMPPKAPCPKCVKDKGDDTPKDLYGIRGLGDGEYDPMIPAEWRRCPAIKLDSSVPGMSAVRFQYMALCQYARQARKHWKGSEAKLSKAEAACSEERRQRRELQAQVQELKKQTETMQDLEARLKKWEARKPVINHYLGVVSIMAEDIASMRSQLLSLGVQIPELKYAFEPNQDQHDQQFSRNAHENGHVSHPHEYGSHSVSRKRKRDDLLPILDDDGHERRQQYDISSRDLMPPPLHTAHPRALAHYGASMSEGYDVNGRRAPDQHALQAYGSDGWRVSADGMYHPGYAPSRRSNSPFVQGPVPINQNRSPFHGPSRMTSVRNASHDVRQPLRTLPNLHQNRQTLASSRTQRAVATPSPNKVQAVFETSVASPFFTRQVESSAMRPPSRRSHISEPYRASQQHTSRPIGQQSYPSQQTLQPDFRSNTAGYQQSILRPPSHSPVRQRFGDLHYQQQSFIPQTPRNAQGLLSRPDRPPPVSTQASNAARPNVHANRILHPSIQSSARPGTINPDSALNQFPGVRGVHSQRGMQGYERPVIAQRALASDAGGRRSVRR